eukprot:436317_1
MEFKMMQLSYQDISLSINCCILFDESERIKCSYGRNMEVDQLKYDIKNCRFETGCGILVEIIFGYWWHKTFSWICIVLKEIKKVKKKSMFGNNNNQGKWK